MTIYDLSLGRYPLIIHETLFDREARLKALHLHHQALREESRRCYPSRTSSWNEYSHRMSLWCVHAPEHGFSENIHRNRNRTGTDLHYDPNFLLKRDAKERDEGFSPKKLETLLQCIDPLRALLYREASSGSRTRSPYPYHSRKGGWIRKVKSRHRYDRSLS